MLNRVQVTLEEIGELLQMMDRDLKNSESSGLDPDWRLIIAYIAALQENAVPVSPTLMHRVAFSYYYLTWLG